MGEGGGGGEETCEVALCQFPMAKYGSLVRPCSSGSGGSAWAYKRLAQAFLVNNFFIRSHFIINFLPNKIA